MPVPDGQDESIIDATIDILIASGVFDDINEEPRNV